MGETAMRVRRRPLTKRLGRACLACVALAAAPAVASAAPPAEDFRQANEAARAGDYPRAVAGYRALAAAGERSASLYWNWAQVSRARGARGEAMWALMRARELSPGDRAVGRAVERLRGELNLDPAEIAPEPLAPVRRFASLLHAEIVAGLLLVLSLATHVVLRVSNAERGHALAWASFGAGLLLVFGVVLGSQARPTAVVLSGGAALLDAASPNAEPIGVLREGEVVPILAQSAGYLRIQDSSGARGWAGEESVASLE